MLNNWLKIAFINYRNNWLSSIVNVLGLSIGLCVFLLIFIHWQDEKSYENWIPHKDNIYLVETDSSSLGTMIVSSYPELAQVKEDFPEVEDFTIANSWTDDKTKLVSGNYSVYTFSARVSDSFRTRLSVRL